MKYDEMKIVLDRLLGGICDENIENAKSVLSKETIRKLADTIISGDLDEIDCAVFSGFRYTIEDLCNTLGLNNEAVFLVQHYDYIENSFKTMYSKYEGIGCCSDKSRTVVRRLFDFLRVGTPIEFNPKAKYTFHHPEKVLSDHDSIVTFFTALRNMYYGSPQQYLNCIVEVDKMGRG